jgi:hypothetical protein
MFGLEKFFSKKQEPKQQKKFFRINVKYCSSPMLVCLNRGGRFKVVDSNVKKVYPIGRVINADELIKNLLAHGVGVAILPNNRM